MSQDSAPRIEFPCSYPIKIMGLASEDFVSGVVSICRQHADNIRDEDVTVRASSKGNYTAVTVVIQATGPEQLQSLFQDLKASGKVKMVL